MNAENRPYRGGRVDPPPADNAPDPGRCLAHGCTLRGSVDLGMSGRFMCSAHAWVPLDKLQAVTHALHQHAWLIDHIRALRADGMHTKWRWAAEDFWREAEPEQMQPKDFECRDLYLYRLHLELMFRVGARNKRPPPMVPQGRNWTKRRGNLGAELMPEPETSA